jgi:CRP-like cAMP-binding protein
MARTQSRAASPNHILSRLPAHDFGLLQPHLEAVDLPLRKQLAVRKKRIDHVYFIEAGFASVVANGSGKRQIELGLIGREGISGLGVVMGNDRAPHDTFMQVGGSGKRMSAADLREVDQQSPALHRALLAYAHTFLIQTAQTALANGRSRIEERLARWLLMARDRLDSDDIPLTHEFLAIMLGTQRPGVTVALHALEREGLVAIKRRTVTILDRKALEGTCNGTYASSAG